MLTLWCTDCVDYAWRELAFIIDYYLLLTDVSKIKDLVFSALLPYKYKYKYSQAMKMKIIRESFSVAE